MNLIDTIRALSTSNLTVTACEIAEGRLEVYTKTTIEDLTLAYHEIIAADHGIARVLKPLGWACVKAGPMDPGHYQIWTR